MHRFIKNIAFLFLFAWSWTARGQQVMSIDSVLYFVAQHPTLQSFDYKAQAMNTYASGARNLEPPRAGAGLFMTPYSMRSGMGSLMISVEQMFHGPGKLKAMEQYMSGMSAVELSMKDFEKADMFTMAKVKYSEWQILKKKLSVIQESEALMNLMVKSAEIGYTYNRNNVARVYQAKADLHELQNMKLMIESEIEIRRVELNALMNKDQTYLFDIDTSYQLKTYEMLIADSLQLLKNRSDIETIDRSIHLIKMKQNLELSKRKPDFGINYSHMNNFGGNPNMFTLMAMVSIPIVPWASKTYKANYNGLNYEIIGLEKEKAAIMNEVIGQLKMLQTEITTKKKQLQMYEQNIIPALQNNMKATLSSYEHQSEDLFMVLDAWQALKMARLEYYDMVGKVLLLQIMYERVYEEGNG